MTKTKILLRFLLLAMWGCLLVSSSVAQPQYELTRQWRIQTLMQQPEADDLFQKDGFVYSGGGAPDGKIAKVALKSGDIAWIHETGQTYQPSYPVSNGRVVIFGTFYGENFADAPYFRTFFVGLDDQTGKLRWKIPAGQQNMSAACFADDLAFIGSYDANLYALDWAQGQVKWKTKLGSAIRSTPCVYQNSVVVGGYDGKLYFLNRQTGIIESAMQCGGRIESNPVVANGLIFVIVDAQSAAENYSSAKAHKRLLVINARQKKVVRAFVSPDEFNSKIIVDGADVYFFDRLALYSYDSRRALLSWKVEPGVAPYPILTPKQILLPMNYVGHHGDHFSEIIGLDRATGKIISEQQSGGIGIGQAHYAQNGDFIVTANWELVGYKLTPIG